MTSFTTELEQEAKITSRVLGRVPDDKLTWKPHPRSMTLGQLALHTATIPGNIAGIAAQDVFEIAFRDSPQPASVADIAKAFDESLAAAKTYLEALSDEKADAIWRAKAGDKEVMALPRKWALRAIMFNHLYHHRGQLSVYLRLLDIPVPVIYGASADENPLR
ncbi:MAG TPA: DinB family protein [Bryobacteraceae bacterium]|nr:DinB family protein [Bryobacteraceae bacterium]